MGNRSQDLVPKLDHELIERLARDHSAGLILAGSSKFNSYRLSKWRLYVLERDFHVCQLCGNEQASGRLSAHHIYPKGSYPARAYDLSNGITLCEYVCHMHVVHGGNTLDRGHWERFVPMFENLNKGNTRYHRVVQERI